MQKRGWSGEKVCQGNLREGAVWPRCLRMKGRFICNMDPVFLVTDSDSWYNSLNEGKGPSGSVKVNVIYHGSIKGENSGPWSDDLAAPKPCRVFNVSASVLRKRTWHNPNIGIYKYTAEENRGCSKTWMSVHKLLPLLCT